MTESPCLLIVEDDEPTRTFLADNLTADGYELLVAGGVRDALRELEFHRVDLAVIDVGLPDGSGLDLVAAVRASGDAAARLDARLPIVLLSGRAAEIDRVRGFERGADDFVAKPFAYGELRLRVAALLRRTTERRGSGRLRVGALAIDPASREVRLRGAPVSLSQKEFALLRGAGGRADPGLHEGRAAAGRVGVPGDRRDADAGFPRLPAAAEARRGGRPVRGQRVGRRLPARGRCGAGAGGRGHGRGPRGGGVMGGPAMLAGMGWVAALAAVVVALWLRAALARRAALVAEAAHELRAPLCAAGLALHGAARDPRRLAAAERELCAPGSRWRTCRARPAAGGRRSSREVLDVREVVAQVVEARQDEALGHGAGLYVDAGTVPALVLGGRLRLVQAVGNLVANAAEHGWGDIDVRVRTWRERVTIEVADQGAGPGFDARGRRGPGRDPLPRPSRPRPPDRGRRRRPPRRHAPHRGSRRRPRPPTRRSRPRRMSATPPRVRRCAETPRDRVAPSTGAAARARRASPLVSARPRRTRFPRRRPPPESHGGRGTARAGDRLPLGRTLPPPSPLSPRCP